MNWIISCDLKLPLPGQIELLPSALLRDLWVGTTRAGLTARKNTCLGTEGWRGRWTEGQRGRGKWYVRKRSQKASTNLSLSFQLPFPFLLIAPSPLPSVSLSPLLAPPSSLISGSINTKALFQIKDWGHLLPVDKVGTPTLNEWILSKQKVLPPTSFTFPFHWILTRLGVMTL